MHNLPVGSIVDSVRNTQSLPLSSNIECIPETGHRGYSSVSTHLAG